MVRIIYARTSSILKFLMIMSIIISSISPSKSNTIQQDSVIWTVAFSPDGKFIAAGGNFGSLMILEANSLKILKSFPIEGTIISRVKWHPQGNLLAVITQSNTFKAKILNVALNQWTELDGLQDSFRGLDWNHSGKYLALSHFEKDVSIYSATGKKVTRFEADPKAVTGIDWHPHKDILLTVGSEISTFDLQGRKHYAIQPRNVETLILCVEWHPSGDFFVTGDYGEIETANNKLLQFWNQDGSLILEIPGSQVEYRNIRWNKSGTVMASVTDALKLWNPEGGLLFSSIGSSDFLWGLDWHPYLNSIITSSSQGIISIWNDHADLLKSIRH